MSNFSWYRLGIIPSVAGTDSRKFSDTIRSCKAAMWSNPVGKFDNRFLVKSRMVRFASWVISYIEKQELCNRKIKNFSIPEVVMSVNWYPTIVLQVLPVVRYEGAVCWDLSHNSYGKQITPTNSSISLLPKSNLFSFLRLPILLWAGSTTGVYNIQQPNMHKQNNVMMPYVGKSLRRFSLASKMTRFSKLHHHDNVTNTFPLTQTKSVLLSDLHRQSLQCNIV